MQHTLSWFIDRIGKRVYRNAGTCNCSGCRDVEKNGLIISTKMHADYLFNCQTDYVDGKIVPWNEYRDTKEEDITIKIKDDGKNGISRSSKFDKSNLPQAKEAGGEIIYHKYDGEKRESNDDGKQIDEGLVKCDSCGEYSDMVESLEGPTICELCSD